MKIVQSLTRTPKVPDPKKQYGAKIESITVVNGNVVFGWAIFGKRERRAPRKKRDLKAKASEGDKT